MSTIGQVERKTQLRVVKLFRDTLKYDHLGDWTDRVGNRNVDENLLRKFLREQQGYDEALTTRSRTPPRGSAAILSPSWTSSHCCPTSRRCDCSRKSWICSPASSRWRDV